MSGFPSIPRSYLFILSGLFWTIAGGILCIRAFSWLGHFPFETEVVLESLSGALALLFYMFLFVKIVRRNIERNSQLPPRALVLAFTSWQGYLMIGLMITLGISLRHAPIPRVYLVVPYSTMGFALLVGSVRFYQQFLLERKAEHR